DVSTAMSATAHAITAASPIACMRNARRRLTESDLSSARTRVEITAVEGRECGETLLDARVAVIVEQALNRVVIRMDDDRVRAEPDVHDVRPAAAVQIVVPGCPLQVVRAVSANQRVIARAAIEADRRAAAQPVDGRQVVTVEQEDLEARPARHRA